MEVGGEHEVLVWKAECEQGIKEKGTAETLLNYVGGAGSVVMGLCCWFTGLLLETKSHAHIQHKSICEYTGKYNAMHFFILGPGTCIS